MQRTNPQRGDPSGRGFKRVFLLCLAFILTLSLSAYVGQFLGEMDRDVHLQELADRYLETYVQGLDRLIQHHELLPEVFALMDNPRALLANPNNATLRENVNHHLEKMADAVEIEALYPMDHQGTVLAASNWRKPKSFVGYNFAFRPYFTDALTNGTGRYLAMGKVSGRLGLYLSRRIDRLNATPGVVVVKVGFDRMERLFHSLAERQNVVAVLTGPLEVVLTGSLPAWTMRSLHVPAPGELEKIGERYSADVLHRPPVLDLREIPSDALVRLTESVSRDYWVKETDYPPLAGKIRVFLPNAQVHHAVKDGRTQAMLGGTVVYLVGLLFYLQHRSSKRIKEAAIRDPLTGLYNRLHMEELLPGMLARDNRSGRSRLALILLDLDYFKRVNDDHGHLAGDAMLRKVGQQILDTVRQGDVPIRYGGEEFAIFVYCENLESAIETARRIRARLIDEPMVWRGQPITVTASIGVAMREINEDLDEFLHRVDQKLFAAKQAGRDHIAS